MNIIEEYIKQQEWRNWDKYLKEMPSNKKDRVIDLGCSVGAVSDLFSTKVASVIGIDANAEFIDYCLSKARQNQQFICSDFTSVNFAALPALTGVWASFSLSYLKDPTNFLRSIYEVVKSEGWIALVDVSNFISGNMLPECRHYEKVRKFESESIESGSYDFNFGSKMELILKKVGFEIIHVDNNVLDEELNFNGAATEKILINWRARLERMQGLRNKFPAMYSEIVRDILDSLASDLHRQNGNLRFVVAKKI